MQTSMDKMVLQTARRAPAIRREPRSGWATPSNAVGLVANAQ